METITVFGVKDFRKWLIKNHDKENKVSLVIYKKHTGKLSPSHRELMGEAICFGWIDTTLKGVDENKYIRNFSKRNKNSKWSNNTQKYAKELIKQKRMTPTGLKFYKEGLKKPTLDFGIPKNPDIPLELDALLNKNKKARKNFDSFSASTKKVIYRWILRGKREETRSKRIRITVKNAEIGSKGIFETKKIN
jgi:uncharacterized protein YdeI (YjbR/CyaY-like superfamily)